MEYSNKKKKYFDKFDYKSYMNLLNLKYLIKEENFELNKLKDIKIFFDFLLIKLNETKVKKICFRNNLLQSIFDDNYNNYTSKFKNINSEIFYEISKSEEGINLERQIIYDLIVSNLNIKKVKVKQIFCINSFPAIEFDMKYDYLFLQSNTNAPYYDIGYLYYINGLVILKICQIGINKDADALKKLNKYFILFDISYFCQKLRNEKGIKIDKIEFCLITTYNGYLEYEEYINNKILSIDRKYPNFEAMKQFCDDNKFIFIIYDTKTSNFFCYDNNILVPCDLQLNTFQYNVTKICKNSKHIKKCKRLYIRYNPDKNLLGKIKLYSNFDKDKLNDKYNFRIKKNIAIYKRNQNIKGNDDNKQEKNIINKDNHNNSENNIEIIDNDDKNNNIEKNDYIDEDYIIDNKNNIEKEKNINEDVKINIKNNIHFNLEKKNKKPNKNKNQKEFKKDKEKNLEKKLCKKRYRSVSDEKNEFNNKKTKKVE